jgi:nucleoid-associated protein YgaU
VAELARAVIAPESGDPIPVLFNPNKYSLDEGNTISEIGIPGLGAPVLQYVHGNARSVSLELFFDTWEAPTVGGVVITDVSLLTDQIYGLLAIDGNRHVPPVCKFIWGTFIFTCVVVRVNGQFTLFRDDGIPVRATLTVTLKEYVKPEDQIRKDLPLSADHVKTRTVRRGDTLSSIAAVEYGDPGSWRPIADANAIANPRLLETGSTLVIPAIG